jgi:hypothetical protein
MTPVGIARNEANALCTVSRIRIGVLPHEDRCTSAITVPGESEKQITCSAKVALLEHGAPGMDNVMARMNTAATPGTNVCQ